MNTHQNKGGTEMNVPENIRQNIREFKIYLNCIQSLKSYPYRCIKKKSPCSIATHDHKPLVIIRIKGWCFIVSRSFQTPWVHIPVD